jgi:hypothetical protein
VVNLEIEVKDGLLRVGVHDDARDTPVVRDVSATRTEGRGMWIVQSLARDWGSESTGREPGKTVWFELVALRSPCGRARELLGLGHAICTSALIRTTGHGAGLVEGPYKAIV